MPPALSVCPDDGCRGSDLNHGPFGGHLGNQRTPTRLCRYVYFASGSPISNYTITVKDGELYGDAGMGTYKLIKQDAVDQYKSTSSYGSIISFVRDASTKQVTGLSLAAQGQQLNATKDK